MSQVIGVGFIGAGSVMGAHAKVMQSLDTKAGIVAVADIYEDNAIAMAEKFGAIAHFEDYKEG